MYCRSLIPARQLASVAHRFQDRATVAPFAASRSMRQFLRWPGHPTSGAMPPETPIAGRDHRLQRLEAVLFLAREPLTTRKLSQYANLADGTEARTLIRRLNDLYDDSDRAFRVERVAGGYQLLSRRKLASWIRRLQHVPKEVRLSVPAMETLAVVAYRQPVLRVDLEAIRGVSCGEILRQLMERDLVRIGGRSEELGRPYLYTTTKKFLRLFGLDTLDSLPRVETMRDSDEIVSPEVESAEQTQRETDNVPHGEESSMPVLTAPGSELEAPRDAIVDEELVATETASIDDDDESEYDDDYFDDDDDDEEEDDDIDDDEDESGLPLEDDDDFEDDWEEVEDDEEDDEDWDEEDWDEDEEDDDVDWDDDEEEEDDELD
jgi:segregation and condensation protein B